MNLQGLSIADLKAMQLQLKEDAQLQEASGNTDKALSANQQAAKITEELTQRMHDNGVMLRS